MFVLAATIEDTVDIIQDYNDKAVLKGVLEIITAQKIVHPGKRPTTVLLVPLTYHQHLLVENKPAINTAIRRTPNHALETSISG